MIHGDTKIKTIRIIGIMIIEKSKFEVASYKTVFID